MEASTPDRLNISKINSPAFVIDIKKLGENCEILSEVHRTAGVKILLALKGFAMFSTFPLVRKYLDGVCASSLNEAKLGRRKFGGEVHSYSPAYSGKSLSALCRYSDHIVFNTPGQYEKYEIIRRKFSRISFGLRINPEHSETEIYDPSAPFSRLGSVRSEIPPGFIRKLDGIHIHNLCEKNSDSLVRTWEAVEKNFGNELQGLKWINLGGGHHITREDYDIRLLTDLLVEIRKKYNTEVYLEPGEAVALNAGWLVSRVLETMHNKMDLAVLDTSASCHMPDVLEMPYRPHIPGSGKAGEKKYTYRLGGVSCLAGDVIGEYSFDQPLKPGDTLVFSDMAHYSMVKTTTFNGVNLPSIYSFDSDRGKLKLIRRFGYHDFRSRLS